MILDKITENLPEGEPPAFETYTGLDVNPLAGTVKFRTYRKPNKSMSIIQKRFISHLRSLKVHLPFATGAGPGNSPLENTKRHRYNRYLFLTDIENAYKNVIGAKLVAVLCYFDPRFIEEYKQLLDFLKKYCLTPEGGLIIGANASPDLFNLYAAILLDLPLASLCRKYSLTYTRYLDDITISAPKVPIGRRKRKKIREIVERAGFSVSHRKSQVLDLKKGTIKINGVGLEWGGRIFLPRHFARRINGVLHIAMTTEDISPAKVHGLMGVFFNLTDRHNLNKTEQKLVRNYRIYCRLIKWGIQAN